VPFFPKDWTNPNSVFNMFLERDEKLPDTKHVGGARPTSGKHYSRHFDSESVNQFLHKATQPPSALIETPGDDAMSQIARNYEDTLKVEELLNKLNNYLQGGPLDKDVDKSTVFSLPQI